MFPDIDTSDLLDDLEDIDIDKQKPIHIYDTLDTQREQENAEDLQAGAEEDPEFAARDPTGLESNEKANIETFKYKKIVLPGDEELRQQTRRLVPEQRDILDKVIEHCKRIVKARKSPECAIPGELMICHGGAGVGKSVTINIISLWAEKILRKSGDNPNYPRVLICAHTGKAASIISK